MAPGPALCFPHRREQGPLGSSVGTLHLVTVKGPELGFSSDKAQGSTTASEVLGPGHRTRTSVSQRVTGQADPCHPIPSLPVRSTRKDGVTCRRPGDQAAGPAPVAAPLGASEACPAQVTLPRRSCSTGPPVRDVHRTPSGLFQNLALSSCVLILLRLPLLPC